MTVCKNRFCLTFCMSVCGVHMSMSLRVGAEPHIEARHQVFPYSSPLYFFEPGFLTEPGAQQFSKASLPVSLRDPCVPAFPELKLEACNRVLYALGG